MVRRINLGFALITLLIGFANIPAVGQSGRIFYVDYASGSNSNNGTSKSTPWKTHPYMQSAAGCTGTGSGPAYSHQAGDQFIFKGNVTWPAACFPMNISAGGSSTSVEDLYTADQTWFTGGGFTKPVFSGTGVAMQYMVGVGASFVTISTLDIGGNTISATGGGACLSPTIQVQNSIDNVLVTNSFLHDWRLTTATNQNGHGVGGLCADWYKPANVVLDHSEVRDDGNFCGTVSGGNCTNPTSGTPIPVGVCGKNIAIAFSHCHFLLEGIVSHLAIHDSEFDNMNTAGLALDNSGGAYHTNVIESGSQYDGAVYNNAVHDVSEGVTIFECAGIPIYNNVMWNAVAAGGDPPIMIDSNCGSTSSTVSNLYNNTVDCGGGLCFRAFERGTTFGQLNAQNNIWINTGYPLCINNTAGGCANITPGGTVSNNYAMSSSEASTYGFTSVRKYAPSSSDPHVAAQGINLLPRAAGGLAALASDTAGAVWYGGSYNNRTTTWDLGAFVSNPQSTTTKPSPPSNLAAIVQ